MREIIKGGKKPLQPKAILPYFLTEMADKYIAYTTARQFVKKYDGKKRKFELCKDRVDITAV